MKNLVGFILVGVFSAVLAVAGYNHFAKQNVQQPEVIIQNTQPASLTKLSTAPISANGFVDAAKHATPAVVHIQTSIEVKNTRNAPNSFWDLFGEYNNQAPQGGSGSGVIISKDGYIATNNHVIEDADKITVTLNDKREYDAKLIGRDPSTDLAVIKIDDNDLDYLTFANSDAVEVGEWVLAVGNPFNLASTVTAGIVSAKGRNINILREKAGSVAIESFIQTDAAVNPGNSGGALVDLEGNLVGINTAIATPTGTFAGYSFAVPANLVNKVVNDMIDYGAVQRGYMGVSISTINAEQAKEYGLEEVQGVLVSEIVEGSGADDAGVLPGDVITKVNGSTVKSSPELQEIVGRFSPGDEVSIEFIRDEQLMTKSVQLKSRSNETELITKSKKANISNSVLDRLGANFESLSSEEARKLKVRGGVKVNRLKSGILADQTQMQNNFVILKVNNMPITSTEQLQNVLERLTGEGIILEGKYPGVSGTKYYAFGM